MGETCLVMFSAPPFHYCHQQVVTQQLAVEETLDKWSPPVSARHSVRRHANKPANPEQQAPLHCKTLDREGIQKQKAARVQIATVNTFVPNAPVVSDYDAR